MAESTSDGAVGSVDRRSSPSLLRLTWSQVGYANRVFLRTPVAAFFTIVFPLVFLVVLSATIGNHVIDERAGIRVAQFLTPVFAVFGVVMASFCTLAIAVAVSRENGVLKRLRGTPLPPLAHLLGRIGSAVCVSAAATVVLVAVGVVFYDVQIVWAKVPALILTLLVGIGCFTALGLAVVAVLPTSTAVQAVTMGAVMALAFISDIFAAGPLPEVLSRLGWMFPLKHFANAVADDFNPFLTDAGYSWDHLAVMLAWGALGLVVALRWFRWEPRRDARAVPVQRRTGRRLAEPTVSAPPSAPVSGPVTVGRPSRWRLAAAQLRVGVVALLRDPSSMFFAVAFPVLLMVFFGYMYRDQTWRGVPFSQWLAPVMAAYGVATAAYVNLPQQVAQARTSGALKRLAGTPLPTWLYLVGRIGAALVCATATTVLTFGVGAVLLGVRIGAGDLPAVVVTLLVGTLCFSLLGLALVVVARTPQAVTAIALGTLIPLSFVSDIFLVTGGLPTVLDVIGWTFPLRHFTNAAFEASSPVAGSGFAWGHLGIMLLWAAGAAVVAVRLLGRAPETASPGEAEAGTDASAGGAGAGPRPRRGSRHRRRHAPA